MQRQRVQVPLLETLSGHRFVLLTLTGSLRPNVALWQEALRGGGGADGGGGRAEGGGGADGRRRANGGRGGLELMHRSPSLTRQSRPTMTVIGTNEGNGPKFGT